MTIGLLINNIDTNGGIQKNYRLLYELFKSKGHDVFLFVLNKPKLVDIEDENIIFLEGKYLFQKGKNLRKHIKSIGEFNLFIVNAVKLKKYLDNQNYIVTVHNTWSKKIVSSNFLKKWKRFRSLEFAFKNENIVGISKGVIDDVDNVLEIKTNSSKTIYAPHNFQLVNSLSEDSIEVEGDYILGLGGLQKRKRFDLLINAFSKILKKNPNLKLVIVGNGSEKEKLDSLVENLGLVKNVYLLGFRENPYPYIKNAKLLVSCSFEEGLPRVLVESLILDTPIVSTESSSSIIEIMSEDLEQFICRVDDEKDLEEKISKALEVYPRITQEHYNKFNQENIYKEYIKLANK